VPQLLGPQLKSLDFTSLRLVADKQLMGSLYGAMAEACPNLERLVMGQSFFFFLQLVADLNKRLHSFTKVREAFPPGWWIRIQPQSENDKSDPDPA